MKIHGKICFRLPSISSTRGKGCNIFKSSLIPISSSGALLSCISTNLFKFNGSTNALSVSSYNKSQFLLIPEATHFHDILPFVLSSSIQSGHPQTGGKRKTSQRQNTIGHKRVNAPSCHISGHPKIRQWVLLMFLLSSGLYKDQKVWVGCWFEPSPHYHEHANNIGC